MKNVCFVDPRNIDLPNKIGEFNIFKFEAHNRICEMFPHLKFSIKNFIRFGPTYLLNKSSYAENLNNIQALLREKNEDYSRLIFDFKRFIKTNKIDSVIFWLSPFHPEVLYELKNVIKIGLMIDDPYSTYFRTQPYFNFLQGIAYISPSYSENMSTKDFLKLYGVKKNIWWPLSTKKINFQLDEKLISSKKKDIVYCGNPTGRKYINLIKFKNQFKNQFNLNGFWGYKGFYGLKGLITGEDFFLNKIKPYNGQLFEYYKQFKIGINIHVSEKIETGNMRMYQLPACGVMQICDKSALDLQNQIFEDGKEIVYYDNYYDMVEKTNYYLNNNQERIKIAFNGYMRYKKDYEFNKNLIRLLNFSCSPIKEI